MDDYIAEKLIRSLASLLFLKSKAMPNAGDRGAFGDLLSLKPRTKLSDDDRRALGDAIENLAKALGWRLGFRGGSELHDFVSEVCKATDIKEVARMFAKDEHLAKYCEPPFFSSHELI
jgi:hypothetical protein